MISPNDIKVTKNDLTLFTTILVVTNLVDSQFANSQKKLFDKEWMNVAVATLLGVALHGLLTNQISSVINTELKLDKTSSALVIYDIVKFGTIFISQRVIGDYMSGKEVVFGGKWLKQSGAIIAGYGLYSVAVGPIMPKVSKQMQPVINDTVKVSMGALIGNFVVDGKITQDHLMTLSGVLLSFLIFNLFTKKLVESSEHREIDEQDKKVKA
jgi:hypothetical protein